LLSNNPSVFGLVIIMPATSSSSTAATASGEITPRSFDLISTVVKPIEVTEAGLVP